MAKVAQVKSVQKPTNQNTIYSDFLSSFGMHPNKKDLLRNTNEESVKSSIRNILLTNRGERLFNSLIGSDINKILFENISPITESNLKTFIETAITNYEPRAKLQQVLVSGMPDMNAYNVTIVFTTINTSEPITVEMLLERTR